MKSGNLNFLEPSGPLQACNGTDLPLPVTIRTTRLYIQKFYMALTLRLRVLWVYQDKLQLLPHISVTVFITEMDLKVICHKSNTTKFIFT